MHLASKVEESTALAVPLYEGHGSGFRRSAYVYPGMGSVHMGTGVCFLAPGGSIHAASALI